LEERKISCLSQDLNLGASSLYSSDYTANTIPAQLKTGITDIEDEGVWCVTGNKYHIAACSFLTVVVHFRSKLFPSSGENVNPKTHLIKCATHTSA
jgi:hypothetical protein